MLYVPTGRVSAYAPEAFVDVVREDVPVTATVAPTTGLPPEVTVPESVPVGPRGAAVTAARASMRPSPQTLLSSAVPPQVRSDKIGRASCRERAEHTGCEGTYINEQDTTRPER